MKTKLIQKIKEDFLSKKHELWHNEVCPFWIGYGKCDCHMPEIWNFIEKAISQSKEELVEEVEKWLNENKYPERNGTSLNMVCYEDLVKFLEVLNKQSKTK